MMVGKVVMRVMMEVVTDVVMGVLEKQHLQVTPIVCIEILIFHIV